MSVAGTSLIICTIRLETGENFIRAIHWERPRILIIKNVYFKNVATDGRIVTKI